MRKTLIAAVLGLFALCACSSPPPSSSSPTPSAKAASAAEPVSGVPSPDADETAQLLAALAEIDPALDHKRSVGRARNTCQAILAGEEDAKVLAATQQRFNGTANISTADARKIMELVEGSGWCR
jgi:hypothetical protein